MQRIKNIRLATQGIVAVLLFGIAFVAGGAEQMMRAPSASTAVQPIAAPTAVVAPTGIPPAAKPPNPNTTMQLVPPTPSGGVMQVSPAAACGMNNTPRISSINGRASAGIVFKPGDALNIAGCGFGKGGQVALIGVGPLIIDGWDDANIRARIDPALSRVRDVDSGVKLYVKPNGAAEMLSQVTHSFKAVYKETILALMPPEIGVFSSIYGAPTTNVIGTSTRVSRSLKKDGFCPAVTNQLSQMSDFYHVEIVDDALPSGVGILDTPGTDQGLFEVIAVNYTNETDQTSWDTQREQMVLVGDGGKAEYDKVNKNIKVTFQGHSTYVKKGFLGVGGGKSTCTSSYTVSLTVRAPRGFKPAARVRPVTMSCRGSQCR